MKITIRNASDDQLRYAAKQLHDDPDLSPRYVSINGLLADAIDYIIELRARTASPKEQPGLVLLPGIYVDLIDGSERKWAHRIGEDIYFEGTLVAFEIDGMRINITPNRHVSPGDILILGPVLMTDH